MTPLPPVPVDGWPTDPRSTAELAPFLDRVAGRMAPQAADEAQELAVGATVTAAVVESAISALRLRVLASAADTDDLAALWARVRRPDPRDDGCPSLAGVCTWPRRVGAAVTGVGEAAGVTAVVGGAPKPRRGARRAAREVTTSARAGAGRVEAVCDPRAIRKGRYGRVGSRLVRLQAAAAVDVGVLFDVRALDRDELRRAGWVALLAGARSLCPFDARCSPALLAATWVLADVAGHYEALTGTAATVQPTEGIRTAADAAALAAVVHGVLGGEGRERLRVSGDEKLLDALVAARRTLR